MRVQVDAVYQNGVLKPLQPLDLAENDKVLVTVVKAAPSSDSPHLDIAYIESLQQELRTSEPVPGLDEVRRRLSKIPGSMTADFAAEREER
jgi:predicted DNA-binding antitoxin AbrB/MazE fold protein